jgi:hypothetical protein
MFMFAEIFLKDKQRKFNLLFVFHPFYQFFK